MIQYGTGILLLLLGLAAHFLVRPPKGQSNKLSRVMLGMGMGIALASLLLAEATVAYKFKVFFRDTLILGFWSLLVQIVANWKGRVRWLLFVPALGGALFYWIQYPMQAFPQFDYTTVELDPTGELLVEIKQGENLAELQNNLHRALQGLDFQPAFELERPGDTDLDDYYAVDIPDERVGEIQEIIKVLRGQFWVDWVEPNEIVQLDPMTAATPQRRSIGALLNDPGLDRQWAYEPMQVAEWYVYVRKEDIQPKKTALIAILDTGVDAGHEDLKAQFRSLEERSDRDTRGHGTHCAGIAAAVSNNRIGVASLVPNPTFVNVTSIKVLSDFGGGTQRSIINGMLKAADKGADVISLSLGGRSNQSRQRAYTQTVAYANQAGAIVVAAAGNANANARDYAPVNAAGIIGVSAVDTLLQKATFSNTVQDIEKGIAAPGVKIYSTLPNNTYGTLSGTSMATPQVAGLIGLMKSLRPELTTNEAYEILNSTGIPTKDNRKTGRFIQPKAALERLGH